MAALPKTIIVVPCYNEAQRLDSRAFERVVARCPSLHLLFVDDGSTDETLSILQALAAAESRRVQILQLAQNCGKAEAVRQGVLQALDETPVVVGYWDADLACPLDEWEQMCRLLLDGEAQMVFGSRVKLLGRRIERKAPRHYAGRLFASAASLALRLGVYDTQCGAKLFRSGDLLRRIFSEPFVARWVFDVEILARAQRLKPEDVTCLALEYPLHHWVSVQGSKLKWRDFPRAAADLMKIAVYARRRDNGR